eukprot:scaffold131301_cov32-Tisochrysis_lutea.AAC.11
MANRDWDAVTRVDHNCSREDVTYFPRPRSLRLRPLGAGNGCVPRPSAPALEPLLLLILGAHRSQRYSPLPPLSTCTYFAPPHSSWVKGVRGGASSCLLPQTPTPLIGAVRGVTSNEDEG